MHKLSPDPQNSQAIEAIPLLLTMVLIGLAACAESGPTAEIPLTETWVDPGSRFRVEVQAYAFPDRGEGMNHLSYGLSVGRDGLLYVGIGNNRDNGYFYRFDTTSGQFVELGNFRDALAPDVFTAGNYGKFHTEPYQATDGSVWVASHPREYSDSVRSGRLFQVDANAGMRDRGAVPSDEGVYFMTGDDRHNQLYLVDQKSHFYIYDLAHSTWRDKGKFSSRAPVTGLFDDAGRLYVYGYDGVGEWSVGPPTITRYDPLTDTLETSKSAPPTLWVGAVTPDRETAYTSTYKRADLYRWRFDDWPRFKAEHLGRIDPGGRAVYSNNLSLPGDGRFLVVAGTVAPGRWMPGKHEHGVWVFELHSGRRQQVARLNDVISRSLGMDSDRTLIYWTNSNTVDEDGWVWIGIHTMPSDDQAQARLIGIRVSEPSAGP
jgi:hypothetical protein